MTCVYIHIYIYKKKIIISSELDRFQKEPNLHKKEDKPNPKVEQTIPEVGGQTKLTPKLGPKENE